VARVLPGSSTVRVFPYARMLRTRICTDWTKWCDFLSCAHTIELNGCCDPLTPFSMVCIGWYDHE
jgi:hypothetical protein